MDETSTDESEPSTQRSNSNPCPEYRTVTWQRRPADREVTSYETPYVSVAERFDYLMIVAAIVGADVMIAPGETDKLQILCAELDIPRYETRLILDAAHHPTRTVKRHLDALRVSSLKFALLSDCLSIVYADDENARSKQTEIRALARALDVNDDQIDALEECVLAHRSVTFLRGAARPKSVQRLAEHLTAVGVPVSMVAALSALGFAGAGVSAGAAALIGLGVASGFGAILGLNVGTRVGVKWLYDNFARSGKRLEGKS